MDTYGSFVWEPSLVKTNAITAATEAACLVSCRVFQEKKIKRDFVSWCLSCLRCCKCLCMAMSCTRLLCRQFMLDQAIVLADPVSGRDGAQSAVAAARCSGRGRAHAWARRPDGHARQRARPRASITSERPCSAAWRSPFFG